MTARLISALPLPLRADAHAADAAASPTDLEGEKNAASAPTTCGAPALDSSALLQGQKAVTISHNGAAYRLQSTKLGKLILTK